MILCSEFWTSFWPNFASTLGGLLIGLPIALWTNRIIISGQNKKQQRAEIKRLQRALEIIKQTLIENRERLIATKNVLNDSKVQFETQFDTSAWDAVKIDIIQFLHNPLIQKKIAYHFSRLSSLADLNDMYLDKATGISSTISGSEKARESLKSHILKNIDFLITDAGEILELVDKENI